MEHSWDTGEPGLDSTRFRKPRAERTLKASPSPLCSRLPSFHVCADPVLASCSAWVSRALTRVSGFHFYMPVGQSWPILVQLFNLSLIGWNQGGLKLFITKMVTEIPRKERQDRGGGRGKFSEKRV